VLSPLYYDLPFTIYSIPSAYWCIQISSPVNHSDQLYDSSQGKSFGGGSYAMHKKGVHELFLKISSLAKGVILLKISINI